MVTGTSRYPRTERRAVRILDELELACNLPRKASQYPSAPAYGCQRATIGAQLDRDEPSGISARLFFSSLLLASRGYIRRTCRPPLCHKRTQRSWTAGGCACMHSVDGSTQIRQSTDTTVRCIPGTIGPIASFTNDGVPKYALARRLCNTCRI